MKIFLYADSRGCCLDKKFAVEKYETYVDLLKKKYEVDAHVGCWLSLVGFLDVYEKIKDKNYDFIIMHAGIVDHAPRRRTVCENKVYKNDKGAFDKIFGEKEIKEHFNNTIELFNGEKFSNMYSVDMAEKHLIPRLKTISNLIWISHNKYVINGAFSKKALNEIKMHVPKNINIILDYACLFKKYLNVVDLTKLSDDEIKEFSFDSVHFNQIGHNYLCGEIVKKLESVILV